MAFWALAERLSKQNKQKENIDQKTEHRQSFKRGNVKCEHSSIISTVNYIFRHKTNASVIVPTS